MVQSIDRPVLVARFGYCTYVYMICLLNQFHGDKRALLLPKTRCNFSIVVILIVLIVIPVYHFICSTTVFTKTANSHLEHKLYYI